MSLKDNLSNKFVNEFVTSNKDIKRVYQVSFKLEGLKRHISTHAAGVVISSVCLDDVIPVCNNAGELLTGVTMEYLEDLGLLKMDFLALRNLTIIQNVLELIEEETGKKISLADIPLDDKETINVFKSVDTEGIFQYESSGMKNFLSKLKPDNFSELVAAVALFRPGPMDNIDSYIRRMEGKEKVTYLHKDLEPILSDTYGIIIYQEQIMQIATKMAGFTLGEADILRRAMSKKNNELIDISKRDTYDPNGKLYDTVEEMTQKGIALEASKILVLLPHKAIRLSELFKAYLQKFGENPKVNIQKGIIKIVDKMILMGK
jgi:DNA polymerase-3 subunit alpha